MANRKLASTTPALTEHAVQAFDRRGVVGRNIDYLLTEYFPSTNQTMHTALFRRLGDLVIDKGFRNFDGTIAAVTGRKYVAAETVASPFSGRGIKNVYTVGFTLRADGETVCPAGRQLGTRLQFDERIGPDQRDTLLLYLDLVHDPQMREKLPKPKKSQQKKWKREQEKTLEETLDTMPARVRQLLAEKNIDLKAVGEIGVLKHGADIADGWSAAFYAVDKGTKRNALNWFREKAAKDDLPTDVRQAWLYLNQHPHLVTDHQKELLGTYRLQVMRQHRDGMVGKMPKELRWLAEHEDAAELRKVYCRTIDLSQKHEPAAFYAGDVQDLDCTIDELLGNWKSKKTRGSKRDEKYWTIADAEGILRKFPLEQFRTEQNTKLLGELFGDAKLDDALKPLYRMLKEDHDAIKCAKGRADAARHLGSDYPFVRSAFGRMDDSHELRETYDREKLVKRTYLHESQTELDKLYTLAQKAKMTASGANVMRNDYVPAVRVRHEHGIRMQLPNLLDIAQGAVMSKTQLRRAKLDYGMYERIISQMPELIREAEHGLVRKDYARAFGKLYQLVKDAKHYGKQ